jgi:GAF domain-containing protein
MPQTMMEVPDAQADARFRHNPFVTGALAVRFYAGMPLVTEGGEAIGTVCVLDRKPRQLDERQRAGLTALSRLTMTLLAARLHEQQLERAVLLADAMHADVAPLAGYSVAIFQVQDFAGQVRRLGERMLERHLGELEQRMQQALRPGSGDSVNRTSQSPDLIAVLHGNDTRAVEAALQQCVQEFVQRSGIPLLSASAAAESAGERIEHVYVRADEALTHAKNAAVAALAA